MTSSARLLGCVAALLAVTAVPALAQEAVAVTQEPVPVAVPVATTTPAPAPAPQPSATAPAPEVVVVVDPVPAPVPAPNDGRFAALPPGGQKIAQALYDAQIRTAAGAGTTMTIMSRDDIAAAHGQQGWGNVFKQMQAQGLVQERNLGQVMSGGRHVASVSAVIPQTTTSVAAPSVGRHSAGTVSYGNGGNAMVGGGGGRHAASLGISTGAGGGMVAGGQAGATNHGHGGGHAASMAVSATTVSAAGGATAAHGGGERHGGGKVK